MENLLSIEQYINKNNIQISYDDPNFVDIWIPLKDNKEILITNNLLIFLGFTNDKFNKYWFNEKSFFIEMLKNNNIKYQEINFKNPKVKFYDYIQNEIKNSPPRILQFKQWLLLSIEDFKNVIMLLNNPQAKKYYIQLETLYFNYFQYTKDYHLNVKQHEINKLKQQNEQLQALNINMKKFINYKKNQNEYIYIATSINYAKKNYFKVGKSENLINELSKINLYRKNRDHFYICYYERVIDTDRTEKLIFNLLKNFIDKRQEMIIIHYTPLLNIVKLVIRNINEPYEYINKLIKIKNISNIKYNIIPKKLKITNESIIQNDLKNEFLKIIDEYTENNDLKIDKKKILQKFNMNDNEKKFAKLKFNNII